MWSCSYKTAREEAEAEGKAIDSIIGGRDEQANWPHLTKFIDEKIRTLGTSACPAYHLSIVIGGTSAEMNLKTVKLASCRYLDTLPSAGNKYGQAYRDRDFEAEVLELTRNFGIGAQFGGK